ncbi:MAG: MMPL family transporter, partial [Cellvibrionales bacterium]|nr:MMPL family transporter [Cellvibrionales bacterium]
MYQKPFSPALYKGKTQPFTSFDQHKYVESVRDVVARYEADDFQVTLSGGPLIGDTLLSKIAIETPIFAVASNLVIFLLLYFLFRRFTAVILPILIIDISLASTLGVMALSGTALSSFSQILPAFILTVGVCDSVHFLSIFFQHYNKNKDKRAAISHALGHTGMPILLTSATTAMGMLSFALADIIPIADLGLFAALGVFIVFFNTLFMLPALMALVNIKPSREKNRMIEKSQGLLLAVGRLGWQKPKTIISIFTLISVGAIYSV